MPIASAIPGILHVLAVVIWVGGMFFAYMALRPVAAGLLEPPTRLGLWVGVFGRFFPWVWASVALILATGLWMIATAFGGVGAAPVYVHLMYALGLVMMALFLFVFFVPYRRLRRAVAAQDWPAGGRHLAVIRRVVGTNTLLGLVVVAVAYSKLTV
ncbi:MAG: CopD family protein [Chromatiales bacterium]|jgi:uncharacterized membrane protein